MGLALDEPARDDLRQEIDGILVVISEYDARMALYAGPARIDWIETGWRRGFTVHPGGRTGLGC